MERRRLLNSPELGSLLREHRLAQDPIMTQAALASKIGYSPEWVKKIEAGTGTPSEKVLSKYLAALGLNDEAQQEITERFRATPMVEVRFYIPPSVNLRISQLAQNKDIEPKKLMAQLIEEGLARYSPD